MTDAGEQSIIVCVNTSGCLVLGTEEHIEL